MNVCICEDGTEIKYNTYIAKIGFSENKQNLKGRRNCASKNMKIKDTYLFSGTQATEKMIHNILQKSVTRIYHFPIEKENGGYYTEYYINDNNIIPMAINFIWGILKKYNFNNNDTRLRDHVSLLLDTYLTKNHNSLINENHPIFIK